MASRTSNGGNVDLEHASVLVADDDTTHRRGVREALEANGFVVVAEAGDADTAINATTRLRPDILLLEIELPGDGLAAVGRIAKASPQTLITMPDAAIGRRGDEMSVR